MIPFVPSNIAAIAGARAHQDEPAQTCAKCGHRVIRDAAGWMHAPLVPMSPTERRKLRHVVKVAP